MNEQSKENLSQQEKLALWRSERENRKRDDTQIRKPISSRPRSRRPVLAPLPGRDRHSIIPTNTQRQCTPLSNLKPPTHTASASKRKTPTANQKSTLASISGASSSDKKKATPPGQASFMQPTSSSSRKSIGRVIATNSSGSNSSGKSKIENHPISSTATRRRPRVATGGGDSLASLPRPSPKTPASTTIQSVRHMSDTKQNSVSQRDTNGNQNESPKDAAVNVGTIHVNSRHLPLTSPLSVFSPSDILEQSTSSDRSKKKLLDKDHISHTTSKKSPNEAIPTRLDEKPSIGAGFDNRRDALDGEAVGDVREDDATFEKPSGGELDDELPALNAALNDFSSLNLSFNLDSSSDEGTPVRSSRISRDRSRVLGPILPIPSLRDDLDLKLKTPTESASLQKPKGGSPSIPPFQSSPPVACDTISSKQSVKATRASGDVTQQTARSYRNKLPSSIAEGDVFDERNVPSRNKKESTKEEETFTLSPFLLTAPTTGDEESSRAEVEIFGDDIEIDDDDASVRPSRSSRDPSRRLGPILPIPSLRDDLSEGTPDTPKLGATHQSSTQKTTNSPLDRNISTNCYAFDTIPEHDVSADETRNLAEPSLEINYLNICSPYENNKPSRRRAEPIFAVDPIISNPDPVGDGAGGGESTEKVGEIATSLEEEQQLLLDSIPLVKHKDRHILTVVPEEPQDTSVIETLQEQLSIALTENRQQQEKLKRYNRSYEDRVTPFRNLFEDRRKEKQSRRVADAQNALMKEVQEKMKQALQLYMQKCHDLEAQLQASQQREAALEQQLQQRK